MKKLSYLVIAALLLGLSVAAAAQKPRIAVIKIKNKSQYWHGRLGPALEDWLVNGLVNTGKFRVIERAELQSVMAEQGLSLSGAVDDKTAVQVGKLLGCNLILHGSVTQFDIRKAGAHGGFGVGFSAKKTTAEGTVDVRLINTTTAEIVFTAQEKGEHSFSKVSVGGFGGGMDFDETMAQKIFEPAVKRIVSKITDKVETIKDSLGAAAVTNGKVAKVSGGKAYISIGSTDGVKEGDSFSVFRLGEAITDPDTGKVLGQDKTRLGNMTVTKVMGEHLSIGVMEGGGAVQVGDLVQRN